MRRRRSSQLQHTLAKANDASACAGRRPLINCRTAARSPPPAGAPASLRRCPPPSPPAPPLPRPAGRLPPRRRPPPGRSLRHLWGRPRRARGAPAWERARFRRRHRCSSRPSCGAAARRWPGHPPRASAAGAAAAACGGRCLRASARRRRRPAGGRRAAAATARRVRPPCRTSRCLLTCTRGRASNCWHLARIRSCRFAYASAHWALGDEHASLTGWLGLPAGWWGRASGQMGYTLHPCSRRRRRAQLGMLACIRRRGRAAGERRARSGTGEAAEGGGTAVRRPGAGCAAVDTAACSASPTAIQSLGECGKACMQEGTVRSKESGARSPRRGGLRRRGGAALAQRAFQDWRPRGGPPLAWGWRQAVGALGRLPGAGRCAWGFCCGA